jgi:hypothetical protein
MDSAWNDFICQLRIGLVRVRVYIYIEREREKERVKG